jgi:hypothetical protein
LISLAIDFNWATPPPLSTMLSAPNTSSTSGLRPVRSSVILAPLSSSVGLAPSGGGERDTNFSPRRLVCRISARAFSGSSVSFFSSRVTSAE